MAKKKEKEEDQAGSVDLESLSPELREAARSLGFKKRASLNKIARTLEYEIKHGKIAWIFTLVLVTATLGFGVMSFVGPAGMQGNARAAAVFIAFWALITFVYARLCDKKARDCMQLEAVVKQKLGV